MLRSSNYNPNQYQYPNNRDTTMPYEYHERVSISESSSPGVLPDVSRYVNAQMIFNKVTYKEEQQEERRPNQYHHQYEKIQVPEAQKRVHFVEKEKITEVDKNKKREVRKEICVDAEADGFIKQKHKNFQLAKWETFKEG